MTCDRCVSIHWKGEKVCPCACHNKPITRSNTN